MINNLYIYIYKRYNKSTDNGMSTSPCSCNSILKISNLEVTKHFVLSAIYCMYFE